ncbi:MAG: insulinase family protein [Phycisphaerales bacterium]|nr:insulinase family protein [Phycisphaerales bacterium]
MSLTFRETELDNGLRIIAEVEPTAHTAAAGFFVKAGTRDEALQDMGVSHFLEHMMFKGSSRRSADEVNRDFDDLGANYNAYTSHEMTCFYGSVLPEHLPPLVEILGDILRPALRDADFNAEKKVILEEIAMYRDHPFWTLYESAIAEYYGEHALGYRVLGTDESITTMPIERMRTYFDTRYSPDNTVIALAGKMDFDAVVGQIAQQCGHWTRTGARRAAPRPATNLGELSLRDAKVTRGYLLMLAPAPAAQDEDRYAAMLLSRVLGDADNSRLHWALVEGGIAEEAQAAYEPRDGCGDYYIYASGDPERLPEIREVIRREVAGLVDSLKQDDLERLCNTLATSVTLAGERPGGRMQRLGRYWTYLGKYMTLEEELAQIQGLTLDDLRAVAQRFPLTPHLIAQLLPAS